MKNERCAHPVLYGFGGTMTMQIAGSTIGGKRKYFCPRCLAVIWIMESLEDTIAGDFMRDAVEAKKQFAKEIEEAKNDSTSK